MVEVNISGQMHKVTTQRVDSLCTAGPLTLNIQGEVMHGDTKTVLGLAGVFASVIPEDSVNQETISC